MGLWLERIVYDRALVTEEEEDDRDDVPDCRGLLLLLLGEMDGEIARKGALLLVFSFHVTFVDVCCLFRQFASSIQRPFTARYDAYTQNIELLDNKAQILKNMRHVNRELRTLTEAMNRL